MTFLLLGAAIGFVAGISPGPVLTLVVTETLRGGRLRGAAVGAGPLLADVPIVLLAVGVLSELLAGLVPALSLVGGLFLLYLAAMALLNARRAVLPAGQRLSARGGLLTGVLARLLAPHPYLFWFLIGGPTLIQANHVSWLAPVAFLVGYYVTLVGSNVGLAVALHRWMGLLSLRVYHGMLLVGSLVLAAYGVALLSHSVQPEPNQ